MSDLSKIERDVSYWAPEQIQEEIARKEALLNEYVAVPVVEGCKGPLSYTKASRIEEAVEHFFHEEMISGTTYGDPDSCRVGLSNGKEFFVVRMKQLEPNDRANRRPVTSRSLGFDFQE